MACEHQKIHFRRQHALSITIGIVKGLEPHLVWGNLLKVRQGEMRLDYMLSSGMRREMMCAARTNSFMIARVALRHFPPIFSKHSKRPFTVIRVEPDIPITEDTQGGIRVQTIG